MTSTPCEIVYKLGKASPDTQTLSAVLTDSGGRGQWQMQLCAPARGTRGRLALLETSVTCPLVSATLGGETYALPIHWHNRMRGGILCLGGTRRTGTDGSQIEWEMRWLPDSARPGSFTLETRARATPHRTGDLLLSLQTRLLAPQTWTLEAAAQNNHCARLIFSEHTGQAIAFTALEGDAGGDDPAHFSLRARRIPFGGGKCVRARIAFFPSSDSVSARAHLVSCYLGSASLRLHPCDTLPPINPLPAAQWLSDPAHYAAPGTERLYLALPGCPPETVQSGAPHYPLDALHALSQWDKFHPSPDVPRLARCGAMGIAADFQVMGRAGEPEPNKGAFWDQKTGGRGCDQHGLPAHGIAANARIARALFLLHESTGERLLHQSALNICQWLILKMNDQGGYDSAHVRATEGRQSPEGQVIPQECALDGAETIRAFVLAFRATRSEVFIKAAGKVASFLLPHMAAFDPCPPTAAASVVRALLSLDRESPQPRLRAAIDSWGAWLRALPLGSSQPGLNADGCHSGLYDCAEAGFDLFAHTRDLNFLRYALHALSLAPAASQAANWRALACGLAAPLSLAALLPQSRIDFDHHSVSLDWRTYSPDPATERHIQVRGGGQTVSFLPLVCRASDQTLLLVLAPPEMERVTILKNGRCPLACDLLQRTFDTETVLHAPGSISWARVGLFTIDP